MNFQQLRIIRETVRRDFNFTEVANALFTSQSGVSKHVKDLEEELGVELFIRKGKRLVGLTEPGQELVGIVDRMLMDAANIRRVAAQFANRDEGELTVVTTHTQARYALPEIVARFKQDFPKVHLALHQESPGEIVDRLKRGEADIGIATEALDAEPTLATFPFYSWQHAVVVPEGHALAGRGDVTLSELAQHPLITYHEGYTGRASIDRAFAEAGLRPDIVMSALDADVIKTYVELGLGVGIVAAMAYQPRKDAGLVLLDPPGLFPPNVTRIAVRRGHYLRGFAYRFIELCSKQADEATVKAAASTLREE